MLNVGGLGGSQYNLGTINIVHRALGFITALNI